MSKLFTDISVCAHQCITVQKGRARLHSSAHNTHTVCARACRSKEEQDKCAILELTAHILLVQQGSSVTAHRCNINNNRVGVFAQDSSLANILVSPHMFLSPPLTHGNHCMFPLNLGMQDQPQQRIWGYQPSKQYGTPVRVRRQIESF